MKIRNPTKSEMSKLQELLLKYGDVPPEEASSATTMDKRKQWLVVTSNNQIVGAGRTYKTDWYEHTLKNLFTIPSARGQGVASLLYEKLTDKAEDEGAKVCEADITATNIPSKVSAVKAGMRPVNSFKWDKKETHADIYQEVFMPPTKQEVTSTNRTIKSEFEKRKKEVPSGVYTPMSNHHKKRRMRNDIRTMPIKTIRPKLSTGIPDILGIDSKSKKMKKPKGKFYIINWKK